MLSQSFTSLNDIKRHYSHEITCQPRIISLGLVMPATWSEERLRRSQSPMQLADRDAVASNVTIQESRVLSPNIVGFPTDFPFNQGEGSKLWLTFSQFRRHHEKQIYILSWWAFPYRFIYLLEGSGGKQNHSKSMDLRWHLQWLIVTLPSGNLGSRPSLDKDQYPAYAAMLLSVRETSSIGEIHNTFQGLDHGPLTDKENTKSECSKRTMSVK